MLSAGQTLILHFLGVDGPDQGEMHPLFTGSPIKQVEPWQYFHLLDRFGLLVPSLSGLLGAFGGEIAFQQELSLSQQREKSRVARHLMLFHQAYASYRQFLERATSLFGLPRPSGDVFEEAVRLEQPDGNTRVAPAGSHEVYAPLLHDLDVLIAAAQRGSRRRREEIFTRRHLSRAK